MRNSGKLITRVNCSEGLGNWKSDRIEMAYAWEGQSSDILVVKPRNKTIESPNYHS